MQKFSSYEVIIYEFLSLFAFDSATNKMSFRLGNEDFFMSIWEIKRALNMPIMFSQFPLYNKNAFWKQLTDLDDGLILEPLRLPKLSLIAFDICIVC